MHWGRVWGKTPGLLLLAVVNTFFYEKPGICSISPAIIFNRITDKIINISPAMAANMISFPSLRPSGFPDEVTILKIPKRMRRNPIPPTTFMARSNIQVSSLSGADGMQPSALQVSELLLHVIQSL